MSDHADTQYPAHAPIDYPEILKRVRKERAKAFSELFASGARATAHLITTRLVEPYRQYRDRREGIRALQQMSDYHLKDIGLTRGDIPAAVAGDFVPARAELDTLGADLSRAVTGHASVSRQDQAPTGDRRQPGRARPRVQRSLHRQRAAEIRRRQQRARNAERALRGAMTEIEKRKAKAEAAR